MENVPFAIMPVVLVALVVVVVFIKSWHRIGPNEQGLVIKKWSTKKLPNGQFIATNGEAGYQLETLRPGWQFKFWPLFEVRTETLVQIPAGSIGIVIAQVGAPLASGNRTAAYNPQFGNYEDVQSFLGNGGQMGIQRMPLAQGTTARIHPVAFIVMTTGATYGIPMSDMSEQSMQEVSAVNLRMVHNTPKGDDDTVLVLTALEGTPDPAGDMASRLGGFTDIEQLEAEAAPPEKLIEAILATNNTVHNDYQDFQAFLDAGGHGGLQHDVVRYGNFAFNPFTVSWEWMPMLVVKQGEVAVVKSFVGLATVDTSGAEFKFGSIVIPGHRGIWGVPLRTGKYALNRRAYAFEIVPTSILTLNWGSRTSDAHSLDSRLSSIHAKSKDGFDFNIDLQVQIHVPDTMAPKVISMVGTMENLVNEVLQSAVGNYFRNALQRLTAMDFIQKRDTVQDNAEVYVREYLNRYHVETRGVYIQDVIFPEELINVLTQREIATQEKQTYTQQQEAETARVQLENVRGTANAQAQLALATVSVDVKRAEASAAIAEAEGRATVTRTLGDADAARIEAIGKAEAGAEEARGLARAAGFKAQQDAIGRDQTALVAALDAVGKGNVKVTPDIMVGAGGSLLDALGAKLLSGGSLNTNGLGRHVNDDSSDREPVAVSSGVETAQSDLNGVRQPE